eukprot:GHVR01046131.1.p1 GENE.GHVR01046131.1~~GHVR01046131.1.p1  ORF type:complete len:137 (-),score=16.09 GHVR01046131.1:66-476(-)
MSENFRQCYFISSLNEYLNVVKLQVERYDPHLQTQDVDTRLEGYIDVMKMLVRSTYTLEESTRVLGHSPERKQTLENTQREHESKLRDMCREESGRSLECANELDAKLKGSDGHRDTERKLKYLELYMCCRSVSVC